MHLQTLHRVHNFYVSIAKYLFFHPEHGIVLAEEPVRVVDASRYGLSPIILYGSQATGAC